jgi:hypothetical protein
MSRRVLRMVRRTCKHASASRASSDAWVWRRRLEAAWVASQIDLPGTGSGVWVHVRESMGVVAEYRCVRLPAATTLIYETRRSRRIYFFFQRASQIAWESDVGSGSICLYSLVWSVEASWEHDRRGLGHLFLFLPGHTRV